MGWTTTALLLGVFLLLGSSLVASASAGLSARLDRDVITLGEPVTLTLSFEDIDPGGPPTLPAIPNINVGGVTTSSEINILNGRQTSRKSYNYTLVPSQPGEIPIPAIQAQVQGRVFTTRPVTLRVLPASAAPADPGLAKQAFLQLVVPKTEIFVGEVIPVDLVLYVVAGREIHMPQIESEGLTVGKMVEAGQTRTVREGQIYTVLTLKTTASAVRPGTFRLGPATMSLSIPAPNARRTFFGDIMDWRVVMVRADAQMLNVVALPTEKVPPDFNGVVGSYSMNVSAGPTSLAVGDPITVKVQIAGRGLLDSLPLPQQPWAAFKLYPASAKIETKDPLSLSGVKFFEQVVIPQNHELKFLPSFRFSFFDPTIRNYRTLSNAPIALTVRPTASAIPPVLAQNSSNKSAPPPADDIVHIKSRIDNVAMLRPPLISRPGFLALQAVPVLVWLTLLVMRKRHEALANNPRLRRQRKVAQRVRDGLKELCLQAEAQKSEQFFATLFRLIQEQLGERLNLPASAITESVIEDHLRGSDLHPGTVDGLHELFQICNQFRYAPMKSKQEMSSLIPRLEAVLENLQKWKGL